MAHHRRRGEESCRECKDATNLYRKQRRAAGLASTSAGTLWTKYRLRPHEFQALIAHQDGRCGICRTPFKSNRATHIDHDHSCCPGRHCCGKCIRGILCARCNTGLAIVEDVERLKQAIAYLGREDVAEVLRESRLW